MSKINSIRSGCRDVFHSYLVSDAIYDGILEIPVIEPTDRLPDRLISFSKAMRTDDYDQWVHFYEDDGGFERVWNRPNYYLPQLKKFSGIITPDFSLYRDMPLVMQQWNTYRGKALGHWWQTQGMKRFTLLTWDTGLKMMWKAVRFYQSPSLSKNWKMTMFSSVMTGAII